MPKFASIDLVVRDVPAATAFFRDVVGLTVSFEDERFAELESGAVTLMLTPDALVPTKPASGIILHFEAPDVSAALTRAKDHGVTILMEPTRTDWGTESAMVAGPEDIVIDFYRPIS
ncbi:MAG: VOC family protein [Chloroflexota bacterium]